MRWCSQASFFVTPAVAQLAVPAGCQPGDRAFHHRPVLPVLHLPDWVLRLLAVLALHRKNAQ